MPIPAHPRAVRLPRHPDLAGPLWILAVAVVLTALGLWTTTSSVSAAVQAAQVAWSPPLALVRLVWVALNSAAAAAGLLLWRARREGRGARGAILLLAVAAVVHFLWLVAFLMAAPGPGPQLWLVLVALLVLDLVTAALACAAWTVSRPAGVLLFVVLIGLVGGTALALGDTALRASLL